MKQFIVDRHTTPNTPTLVQVPTEKIPVYDDLDAAAADLANLSAGQIVATKDTGTELSQPVDVVESGNLHAVTSNAVAEAFGVWEQLFISSTVAVIRGLETKNGKYLSFYFNGLSTTHGATITTLAEKWRPKTTLRTIIFADAYAGFIQVDTSGVVTVYSLAGAGSFAIRGDSLVRIETGI